MRHRKQLEAELQTAHRVQTALVPRARSMVNVDFAVHSAPAGEVGGDLCDVFESDHGRAALVIGDVCGKGVAAALLMSLIYGAVRSMPWCASPHDHALAMERLNDLLRRKTPAEQFATLFTAYYEPETSVLRYISCGHLPVLLLRPRPGGGLHVERLCEGGPLVGIFESGNYRQHSICIQEDDLLLMFSDGVYEAMNASGEPFGEDRLLGSVPSAPECEPAEICNAICREVRSFANGSESADDQTLVVARFRNVCTGGVLPSYTTFLNEELMADARN
jgi:sigma-B regulation protein RsbU (phosphoserine phosphatase)